MRLARAKLARVILAASPIFALGALRGQTKATTPSFEVSSIRPAEFPSPQRFSGGGTSGISGRHAVGRRAPRLAPGLAGRYDPVRVPRHELPALRTGLDAQLAMERSGAPAGGCFASAGATHDAGTARRTFRTEDSPPQAAAARVRLARRQKGS